MQNDDLGQRLLSFVDASSYNAEAIVKVVMSCCVGIIFPQRLLSLVGATSYNAEATVKRCYVLLCGEFILPW